MIGALGGRDFQTDLNFPVSRMPCMQPLDSQYDKVRILSRKPLKPWKKTQKNFHKIVNWLEWFRGYSQSLNMQQPSCMRYAGHVFWGGAGPPPPSGAKPLATLT